MRKGEDIEKQPAYFILNGTASIKDPIKDFRLVRGNRTFRSNTMIRIEIPEDIRPTHYKGDGYSTVDLDAPLRQFGAKILVRVNGRLRDMTAVLKDSSICDADDILKQSVFPQKDYIYCREGFVEKKRHPCCKRCKLHDRCFCEKILESKGGKIS